MGSAAVAFGPSVMLAAEALCHFPSPCQAPIPSVHAEPASSLHHRLPPLPCSLLGLRGGHSLSVARAGQLAPTQRRLRPSGACYGLCRYRRSLRLGRAHAPEPSGGHHWPVLVERCGGDRPALDPRTDRRVGGVSLVKRWRGPRIAGRLMPLAVGQPLILQLCLKIRQSAAHLERKTIIRARLLLQRELKIALKFAASHIGR